MTTNYSEYSTNTFRNVLRLMAKMYRARHNMSDWHTIGRVIESLNGGHVTPDKLEIIIEYHRKRLGLNENFEEMTTEA